MSRSTRPYAASANCETSEAMRVYLDTNFFIRFVEGESAPLLRVIEDGEFGRWRLVTSELTLAEVLVVPVRLGRQDLIAAYEQLLSGDAMIEVLPITRKTLRASAAIRASIGNRGMDAIHVATAVEADCGIFLSSDGGIKVPPQMQIVTLEAIEAGDDFS